MTRKWITIKDMLPKENQKIYYFGKDIGIFRGEYFYDASSISNPHKFHSEHGIVDADDISYWMPYDHGYRDMIPLPPDYKNVDSSTTDAIIDEIKLPQEQREFSFTYIAGDINE